MENSFFIFSEKSSALILERFHICTWEFKNNSALIEFGGEIVNPKKINDEQISLSIYIPWLSNKYVVKDLYDRLKDSENSRFIFNDSVTSNIFLDDGQKKDGVVQNFVGRAPLCIFPINSTIYEKNKRLTIEINLKPFFER